MLYFFKKLTICFYIKNNKFIISIINNHFYYQFIRFIINLSDYLIIN